MVFAVVVVVVVAVVAVVAVVVVGHGWSWLVMVAVKLLFSCLLYNACQRSGKLPVWFDGLENGLVGPKFGGSLWL